MARYQKTNTRETIIAAAEEEFVAKGFAGARTTEIARRANVTHAMLHYYFHTKEELFRAFLEDKVALLAESIDVLFCVSEGGVVEQVERGVRGYFDFLDRNPKLPLFLVREIVAKGEAMEYIREVLTPKIAQNAQRLQQNLDGAAWRGEIRPTDALGLLQRIMSLGISEVLGGCFMGVLFGEAAPKCNHRQENITTIINSLKPL